MMGVLVTKEQLAAALLTAECDLDKDGCFQFQNVVSFLGMGDEFVVSESTKVMRKGEWVRMLDFLPEHTFPRVTVFGC